MDDIDFITDEINTEKQKTAKRGHERNTKTVKHIKVRGSVEVARDAYKAARKMRRQNIKQLKRNIRAQKLMIKQARDAYKLIKLNERR